MVRRAMLLCALVSSCALVACGGGGALVLEVSTDVPAGAGDLDVEISQAGAQIFKTQYRLSGVPGDDGVVLPATLVIAGEGDLPRQGSLTPGVVPARIGGPLGVKVSLSKRVSLANDDRIQVQRSVETDLPGSGAKSLQIVLEQSCLGVSCGNDETCQAAKCVSNAVDTASLPDD